MDAPRPCPRPRHGQLRCRSRRCPSCGVLWAGDQRRKLLANVSHYGGSVAMVTATAPGRDRLEHDVDGHLTLAARYRWNRTAPSRWRALHRAAAQRAARRHGPRSLRVLSRTWEYQRRGMLHVHVLLGVETARELAAAHTYALTLDELRGRLDFGFVSDASRSKRWRTRGLAVIPAERAARYVAKYLSPLDAAGKPSLSQTVLEPDVPPHVVHVDRRLTGETGVTMSALRLTRRLYVTARQERVDLMACTVLPGPNGPVLLPMIPAGSETAALLDRGALLPRPPTQLLAA